MVANVFTVAPIGYDGAMVEVECDNKKGLPGIQIVGLGTKSVDEAKERVRSAVTNSLLDFPAKKITINLAPAGLVKDGAQFDLPIALAILISSGQLRQSEVGNAVYAGELALDGTLRPIRGTINIAQSTKLAGINKLFLPSQNVAQASLIKDLEIVGVNNLKELFLYLKQELKLDTTTPVKVSSPTVLQSNGHYLDDIHGQEQAKRALTIAVAGRHNVLLSGSPGAGKTMLAKTLTNLLPELTTDEQIAVTKIHSIAGEVDGEIVTVRPFRSPHHTTSQIAIIGGGAKPKPGEVSLAHLGVLFLDEIPEYPRAVLESLRQPLEDKKIAISRAGGRSVYPADFMLVATMNPCPCGFLGDSVKECSCGTNQILNYKKRLSGPLLDRIDMTLTVSRVPNEALLKNGSLQKNQHKNASELIKNARIHQINRYGRSDVYNGSLSGNRVNEMLHMNDGAKKLLTTAGERLGLSARSYFKVIKVAQTIADLDSQPLILPDHISEALQYRSLTS